MHNQLQMETVTWWKQSGFLLLIVSGTDTLAMAAYTLEVKLASGRNKVQFARCWTQPSISYRNTYVIHCSVSIITMRRHKSIRRSAHDPHSTRTGNRCQKVMVLWLCWGVSQCGSQLCSKSCLYLLMRGWFAGRALRIQCQLINSTLSFYAIQLLHNSGPLTCGLQQVPAQGGCHH